MDTIVITGANRGIGLELTSQLVNSGFHVCATCRNPEEADNLNLLSENELLSIYQLDVTDSKSVEQFCLDLSNQKVDVLINNAGILGGENQDISDMDYDAWLETFAVNTIAPFRLATSLKTNLLQAKTPKIITISSQMGSLNRISKGSYAYRSSKAAVNKVMQVLALEFEADGIIVCPMHPGWVQTDMGGPEADITVQESASGLISIIMGLTHEKSGRFWTWEGKEHPW